MTKREVVRLAVSGRRPPYVPWNIGLTAEAHAKLVSYYGGRPALSDRLDNHFASYGDGIGFFEEVDRDRVRDHFGVVWNRSKDKDIGVVEGQVLAEPSIGALVLPDPDDPRFYAGMEEIGTSGAPDGFRIYGIGFSLYERAWTLRGMEQLLMDFVESPEFIDDLLGAIADFNIAVVRRAVRYDIDAVYFGDDWGQQHGLVMGPALWRRHILPQLERMYAAVKEAGKLVFIHSCGDVDELFDDLVAIGLDCFNPFQPEVMDVADLLPRYRGRLAFHGGLSTQRTLPYGSADDVRRDVSRLLDLGAAGGYVFAPAHAVEGDVPVENLVAMIDLLHEHRAARV